MCSTLVSINEWYTFQGFKAFEQSYRPANIIPGQCAIRHVLRLYVFVFVRGLIPVHFLCTLTYTRHIKV